MASSEFQTKSITAIVPRFNDGPETLDSRDEESLGMLALADAGLAGSDLIDMPGTEDMWASGSEEDGVTVTVEVRLSRQSSELSSVGSLGEARSGCLRRRVGAMRAQTCC